MNKKIEYFDNLIQKKLEQLPRALKGEAPKEVLEQIIQEMEWLQEAKELLREEGEKEKFCPHCGKCDMNYDTDGSYLNWECKTFP